MRTLITSPGFAFQVRLVLCRRFRFGRRRRLGTGAAAPLFVAAAIAKRPGQWQQRPGDQARAGNGDRESRRVRVGVMSINRKIERERDDDSRMLRGRDIRQGRHGPVTTRTAGTQNDTQAACRTRNVAPAGSASDTRPDVARTAACWPHRPDAPGSAHRTARARSRRRCRATGRTPARPSALRKARRHGLGQEGTSIPAGDTGRTGCRCPGISGR